MPSISNTVRHASAVLLTRGSDNDPEIYLVKRSKKLSFFASYWAFPGGIVEDYDYPENETSLETALIRCAIRELFEETDILSASLGIPVDQQTKNKLSGSQPDIAETWQKLLNNTNNWQQLIKPVCQMTTPPIIPLKYQTQFIHIKAIDNEQPIVDGIELTDGLFIKPKAAINAWSNGKMPIAAPVLQLLKILAKTNTLDEFYLAAETASKAVIAGKLPESYCSPGISMATLKSPTLPPATTTNTYIVGYKKRYIIDPASYDSDEQQRLINEIDYLLEQGFKFEAILLTHHHHDHIGAVNPISQRYKLPVRAHPECYKRIDDGYIKGAPLKDRERLELGVAPDGTDNWHLTSLYTPGHASDHVCFIDSRYQSAIVGDMLSTVSSIVIDPPDGHMQTYMNSLELLLNEQIKTLCPAHGPAKINARELITGYIQHRHNREQSLVTALNSKPQSIEDLLPQVYPEIAASNLKLAGCSLLAGLIKLKENGLSKEKEDGWIKS